MKLKIVSFTFILFFVGIFYTSNSNPGGAPIGHSGAPGDAKCSACHNNSAGNWTGNATITFSGVDNKYVPGQNYTITFIVNEASRAGYGFQGLLLNSSNQSVGIFTAADGRSQVIPGSGGRAAYKYLTHTVAGNAASPAAGTGTYTVNWTAPPAAQGTLGIYACFLSTNGGGNGNESGDHLYQASLNITPGTATGIDDKLEKELFLYPNPSKGLLNVISPIGSKLSLTDMKGTVVFEVTSNETNTEINTAAFSKGIYFLSVETATGTDYKKVIIE